MYRLLKYIISIGTLSYSLSYGNTILTCGKQGQFTNHCSLRSDGSVQIEPNFTLKKGESIVVASQDKKQQYQLLMRSDGNTVTYACPIQNASTPKACPTGSSIKWATNTQEGALFAFQTDGNIVQYSDQEGDSRQALWSSNTEDTYYKSLIFQNDGNLVLHAIDNGEIWSSYHTGIKQPLPNYGNIHFYFYLINSTNTTWYITRANALPSSCFYTGVLYNPYRYIVAKPGFTLATYTSQIYDTGACNVARTPASGWTDHVNYFYLSTRKDVLPSNDPDAMLVTLTTDYYDGTFVTNTLKVGDQSASQGMYAWQAWSDRGLKAQVLIKQGKTSSGKLVYTFSPTLSVQQA